MRPGKTVWIYCGREEGHWRRGKPGQSLHDMRSGASLTSQTAAFGVCFYLAEGFLPSPVVDRVSRSAWRSKSQVNAMDTLGEKLGTCNDPATNRSKLVQ
jgi:hypothetical protein